MVLRIDTDHSPFESSQIAGRFDRGFAQPGHPRRRLGVKALAQQAALNRSEPPCPNSRRLSLLALPVLSG